MSSLVSLSSLVSWRANDPQHLLGRSNAHLDELFRTSPAGPVPRGTADGLVILFPGTPAARPLANVVHALWWKGKIVDADGRGLANRLFPVGAALVRAAVYPGDSWVDGGNCIVLDYSRTSHVAHWIRDEIRMISPGHYLGVVWLARRRVAWFALSFSDPSGS